MILRNLNILLQNVRKNHLIVNTILETQSQFDIILIQKPPWSVIRQVPSTTNSKSENFIETVHHSNWLLFAINPVNKATSPRVTAYINICLSPLRFSLHTDIINHPDILLMSFTNDHVQYFIMNIYSDSSHSALKYLKDTEVNIDNVLVMTGDFNIRDSLWDPSFPHHASISDDLLIIADSFNLALLSPTNSCPTRYFDMMGKANSTMDLMFLQYRSSEINQNSIHLEWRLMSDHASLSITIPIVDEVINTSKLSIQQKSRKVHLSKRLFHPSKTLTLPTSPTRNVWNKQSTILI